MYLKLREDIKALTKKRENKWRKNYDEKN